MKGNPYTATTAVSLLFGLGVLVAGAPANAQISRDICDQDEDGFISWQEADACGREQFNEGGQPAEETTGYYMAQEDFFGEMEEADDPEGLFAEVDTDGDGQISEDEWQTWQEARFAAATEGSEGQMTVEEYDRFSRGSEMAAAGGTAGAATQMTDLPEGTDFQAVVDELGEHDQFSSFVQAVQTAGVADALQGDGPFTVFAPTNDAFSQLGDGTLDQLDQDQLATLLQHHVVQGAHPADALPDQLQPVSGSSYGVDVTENGAVLVPQDGEQVQIEEADIRTDSGFIHGIASVLVPDDVQSTLQN